MIHLLHLTQIGSSILNTHRLLVKRTLDFSQRSLQAQTVTIRRLTKLLHLAQDRFIRHSTLGDDAQMFLASYQPFNPLFIILLVGYSTLRLTLPPRLLITTF